MAPSVPEEVDVFTVPHSRMKDLVNDYIEMLQTTNFSNFADLKLLLDSLSETFKEFKLHEQIENNLIMKRLKNKLKALSIRNTLVCNCHKDTHLTDMLTLVEEGFGKKNDQDRLNYSQQLKKSLEEFTEDFLPHMKQEEEVFQPMLLEYFSYEELCELKRKVIDYHTVKAAEVTEKGLREEAEKDKEADLCYDVEDEEDEEEDWCEKEPEPQTTVLDMPLEVTSQIFSYLDPRQVVQCRQVCRQWNQQALDPHLWSEIHPTKWAEGDWSARMRDVDYDLEEEQEEEPGEEDAGYTAIDDDADIDESELSDGEGDPYQTDFSRKVHRQAEILLGLVKYVLPSTGHSVKVLNLGHCHALTNGMLQRLLKLTPNVEYLNLAGTRISDTGLKGLGKNWCGANLRHLNLSGCENVTDDTLQRVAHAFSGRLVETLVTPCWCEQQRLPVTPELHPAHPAPPREDQPPPHHPAAHTRDDGYDGTGCNGDGDGGGGEPPCESCAQSTSVGSTGDGCHAQCCSHSAPPEPDPIEDCARPVCVSAGYALAPAEERTKHVAVPPDEWTANCINNSQTATCPNGRVFEEDVFSVREFKPQRLLTYLNLSGCHQLTDYGIRALTVAGPLLHLTHLDLSGCGAITGDGLRPLVGACPALNHDTFFYCDNILDGPYADTASGCQNVCCNRRACCRKEY